MKLPTKIVLILVAVCIGIALTQIDFSGEAAKNEQAIAEENEMVMEKAFHTEDLSTFVTALKTAGLEEELNSGQNVTIFAPSDAAFSTLPKGKYAEIMQVENKELLKKILNYHIVPRAISSYDLKDGQVFETIQGDKIKISLSGSDDAKVNGTALVKTNIQASNGIIHIIDKVMMPSENAKAQASLRE